MKKLFIVLIAAVGFSATTANAQDWFVSGHLSLNYQSHDKSDMTVLSIVPSINRMIGENLAVGIGFGYNYSDGPHPYLSEYGENVKDRMFLVRPSVSYIKQLSDKFYYNPELYLNFGFGEIESSKYKNIGVGIAPLSFEFRPTDSLGIGASAGVIGYNYNKFKNDSKATNTYSLTLNSELAFKLRFYF